MVKKMGGFISTNNPVENQQVGVSAYILFCNKYAVRRFIDKTYENFQYDKSAHGPMCAYTKFYSTDKYNNMHFQKMMNFWETLDNTNKLLARINIHSVINEVTIFLDSSKISDPEFVNDFLNSQIVSNMPAKFRFRIYVDHPFFRMAEWDRSDSITDKDAHLYKKVLEVLQNAAEMLAKQLAFWTVYRIEDMPPRVIEWEACFMFREIGCNDEEFELFQSINRGRYVSSDDYWRSPNDSDVTAFWDYIVHRPWPSNVGNGVFSIDQIRVNVPIRTK